MTYKTSSLSSFPSFEIYTLIFGLIFLAERFFLPLTSGFSFTNTKNLCVHHLSIGITHLVLLKRCTDKIQSIVLPLYFSSPVKDLS